MQRLASGVFVCLLFLTTSAFAFDVRIPNRSTAKANIVVDESGAPLFTPANPAQVEVANLPPLLGQPVLPVFFVWGTDVCPDGSTHVFTGQVLVIHCGSSNIPDHGLCWASTYNGNQPTSDCVVQFIVGSCAACRF